MSWSKRAGLAALSLSLGLMMRGAQAADVDALAAKDFAGWKVHQQAEGDLNGDGKPDIAAILSKPAEGGDENGQALLAVYFDDGQGNYVLAAQAPKAICVGCGGPKAAMGEPLGELSIARGQLHITYEGGSREAFSDELKWRFVQDKKQFYVVGETRHVTDTVGGDPEETLDINYLSMKAEKKIGKKRSNCTVPSEFKDLTLTAFDYDGKHIDDLEKISDACDKLAK